MFIDSPLPPHPRVGYIFKAKPGRFCAGLNGRKAITFLIPGLDTGTIALSTGLSAKLEA